MPTYTAAPIIHWGFGTDGSPYDAGPHLITATAASTEVPSGVGANASLVVANIGLTVVFTPNPGTAGSAIQIAVTFDNQGSSGTSNTYAISITTSAGTITSPSTVSNPDSWTLGSWSTANGGVTYTATHTKAANFSGPNTMTFSTTPSAAGLVTVSITAATNSVGLTYTGGNSCTINNSWTLDATSGKGIPATSTEWSNVFTSAGLSGSVSHLWLSQEASGNLADTVGTRTLTATGTLAYLQNVTGWTLKGVKFDDGVAEYVANTGGGTNINTTSTIFYALIDFDGLVPAASTRQIALFGSDISLEMLDTEKLRFGFYGGVQTIGNVAMSGVHPVMIQVDHTNSLIRCITDVEVLSVPFATPSATNAAYMYVGGAVYSSAPMKMMRGMQRNASDALLTRANITSLLSTLGYTAGYATTSYQIRKTAGANGTYDAQSYTTQTYAGTVSVEWVVCDAADAFVIGVSSDNPDANYTGIDRALACDAGTVWKCENGVLTSYGSYVIGDHFRVERVTGTDAVTYYKNGVSLGTGATLAGSLLIDSSFRFSADRATNVVVKSAGTAQSVTWNNTSTTVHTE